jgi:DNA repair protein RAD5
MLITAGSGGAGLTLTAASHVILCEPWWRDSDEQQAIGRAYRLGQKLPVHV